MAKFEMVAPAPWKTLWFRRLSPNSGVGVFFNAGHWGFGLELWPRSTVSILTGPISFTFAYIRPAVETQQ